MMPTIKLKNPAAGKSAGSNWPEIAIPRKKINLDNKAIALCPPAAGSSTGPQDQDIIVRLKDLLGGRKGGRVQSDVPGSSEASQLLGCRIAGAINPF